MSSRRSTDVSLLGLLVMNVNRSPVESYSVASGFQTVESDFPLKLFTAVCIHWCQHSHPRFTNRIQASLKKKNPKKNSVFKLTGTNKCFISINNRDCTRKSFASEYLIVGTFRNIVLFNKAKKEF